MWEGRKLEWVDTYNLGYVPTWESERGAWARWVSKLGGFSEGTTAWQKNREVGRILSDTVHGHRQDVFSVGRRFGPMSCVIFGYPKKELYR